MILLLLQWLTAVIVRHRGGITHALRSAEPVQRQRRLYEKNSSSEESAGRFDRAMGYAALDRSGLASANIP
jgi:hypothetical protein